MIVKKEDIVFAEKPKSQPRFFDLEGRRFGRLLVIGYGGSSPQGEAKWYCLCDCEKISLTRGRALRSGAALSCGCLRLEKTTKHGHCKNEREKQSITYTSYKNARERCRNPKATNYESYGGRGIKFLFDTFEDFLAEVGERPSKKYTIDRIDGNKHYEKGNLRWATAKQQNNNRSSNRLIKIGEMERTIMEWAELSSTKFATIQWRLNSGWCAKCSVFNPPDDVCTHRI